MQDAAATVLSVDLTLPYYRLRLGLPPPFADASPGQFVMLQAGEDLEPYLRRAFSVFDIGDETGESCRIDVLGKVVGRGTGRLAACGPGDRVKTLGPLGRGFRLVPKRRAALVAGGVGSAALLLLARRFVAEGVPFDFFYGGRSADDLWGSDLFGDLARRSGGKLVATTEDGSRGDRGLVTEPLSRELGRDSYDALFGCGPMPLLEAMADLSEQSGVAGEAALETAMGCGYGACLGCAVPLESGTFGLCCKDGPVFAFDEVRW